jgi:hypothetical protein
VICGYDLLATYQDTGMQSERMNTATHSIVPDWYYDEFQQIGVDFAANLLVLGTTRRIAAAHPIENLLKLCHVLFIIAVQCEHIWTTL